ncbi:MAG: single-stranded-DNA-specific exonuclease RecJ [bacterium]
MNRKWQLATKPDQQFIEKFPGIPPLILQLMHNRGLITQAAINEFFNPNYSQGLHSPWLFNDMVKAVKEIMAAIDRKEKITIYGDYDADGLGGTVILAETLEALGADLDIYIPHREKEGYGLNSEAVKAIANNNTKLIITVDCGITNLAEVVLANSLGLNVIITDHHQPALASPEALAIINPNAIGEKYPFKDLAGAGVAFKLVQALGLADQKKSKLLPLGFEKWLLDLVAIATVADMVSLLGENRILVSYGLVVLNKTRRLGLQVLISEIGLTGQITTQQMGFQLGPRLNAAGRLNHANVVYKLLTANSKKEAAILAQELNRANQERQRLTEQIINEIKKELGEIKPEQPVIFAVGNNWPVGVVGLVAGKLCDEYYRPTFVLTSLSGEIKGSGRSIPDFNITKALGEVNDLLSHFGGHTQACGLTLKSPEALAEFKRRIAEVAERELADKDLNPALVIDAETELKAIDWAVYSQLEKLEPFGEDNPKPIMAAYNLEVFNIQPVGQDDKHLRLFLKDDSGKVHKTIGFCFGDWCQRLKAGDHVDIVFEADANQWNGSRELQFKIVDLRINENG